jgi:dipeptidyl-peptidase 4
MWRWRATLGVAAVLGAVLAGTGPAMAADEAPASPAALTLHRVFASPDLNGSQPRRLALSPDGTLLTSLRPRADERDRFDLWATDTRTLASRMLVDSKTVGSGAELSEAEKMQRERARIGGTRGIVTYEWAPDGRAILVPLDGDLFLAGLDGQVSRLTQTSEAELNPTISPRGGHVAFVRDQNLYVVPATACSSAGTCPEPRRLTPDGAGTVHWGEAEFVAQEEIGRSTGYWWSPDDARIAVARFDEAPVGIVTRAAIGADGTRTFQQRYPAAGTPNVRIALYVVATAGGEPVKVDLGRDEDIYLARVDWSPDGKWLYVQRQNRAQTTLDMLRVDPATGKATTLFTEKARARSWINLSDAYHWMPDGSLVWWSERDGWGHLWRFARGRWTQLTRGDWVVTGLVGVDEAKGRAFFTANKDDPLESHVYVVDLAKPGAPVRLTERGWTNGATMDAAATRLIVQRSSPAQPSQVYLADAEGKRLAWVNENRVEGAHPYAPFLAAHRLPEFGTIKAADGTPLHWRMLTPALEPGRRYPVFYRHYGGPSSQTVTRAWGGALDQYLVSRGWIVFDLDNRGSPNRGKAFEDPIYRAMGTVEVADQRRGADYLKGLPFVDGGRIATYGWSYGGYMTLKMLEADPGVYAAGVAGAPVTRWELYDTHYTERYMGDPKADAAAYAASDALERAPAIKDPLLLIHGMSDDNVVFDNSTALAARLQAQATPFEMMFYPGQTHRVAGPGISEHVWGTILDFLDRRVVRAPAK